MGSHDPVIIQTQAARILAKAWADPPTTGFNDTLEKDPSTALTAPVRGAFGIHGLAKLIDLELYHDDLGDIDFDGYTKEDLQSIYKTGQDTKLSPVTMKPNLWITRSGTIIPVGGSPSTSAISLSDWARIYAYIWYQVKFASPKNPAIKDHFEKDPATTLDKEIIPGLKSEMISLAYTYGKTPLITHGAPPLDYADQNLQAISDDPNAKGYRYVIRLTC